MPAGTRSAGLMEAISTMDRVGNWDAMMANVFTVHLAHRWGGLMGSLSKMQRTTKSGAWMVRGGCKPSSFLLFHLIKIASQRMTVHLNLLEKMSSITGELAVYKESGVLAVVRIEKITIEPDMLSFTLKPQRGRRIGLESLKVFSVSSSFEYLDHSDGRYTCSIVSWMLETDSVKVIYLSNLINGNASVDEVLSAMRKRQVFYDDETIKVLSGLIRLKNQIRNRQVLFASEPEFKGQSWGGAGVMVISNDEDTKEQYSHFDGDTVVSEHAPQIGELFRRVRRITATSPKYNYLSKLQFWSDLANAANSVINGKGPERLVDISDKVITKAIEILSKEHCAQ